MLVGQTPHPAAQGQGISKFGLGYAKNTARLLAMAWPLATAMVAPALAQQNSIEDIQVGERGAIMRIALVCEQQCDLSKNSNDHFTIHGVQTSFEISLQGRSALAEALRLEVAEAGSTAGSTLNIVSERVIERASINRCDASGRAASCIDLAFRDAPAPQVHASASDQSSLSQPERAPSRKPYVEKPVVIAAATKEEKQAPARISAPVPAPVRGALRDMGQPHSGVATQKALRQPATVAAALPAAPRLRGAPNEDVLRFARYAPPERFEPPSLAAIAPVKLVQQEAPAADRKALEMVVPSPQEQVQQRPTALRAPPPDDVLPGRTGDDVHESSDTATATHAPSNTAEMVAALEAVRVDEEGAGSAQAATPVQPQPQGFRARAEVILGRALNEQNCRRAVDQLTNDAWDMAAMTEVAFCRAASGDVVEADALFARQLAYTPDNYEALVGRALIAAEADEISVARKFFQDALNAVPPMAESERIVQAMSTLR